MIIFVFFSEKLSCRKTCETVESFLNKNQAVGEFSDLATNYIMLLRTLSPLVGKRADLGLPRGLL